ncbi:TetR/AcrR family transcriptional regulator [Williamsia sp. CHRR-6]|uniref:TetR/AcrR family transcriptional regulator n=1 Tax=Williamsia sp. CHRR-6 TaxID=2835871 RepID=UPI001BD9DF84|nr:TetR/AcrR family transcriptional regulator [Williamsia sp. CHRR-6]MBT0567549.1 TetR/AcrR family transcriptional regulator [Williamsia sp. CHRR-6]
MAATDRRRQRTVAAVCTAARTLFEERGYQAATIADIATHAEVSVSTIYENFPGGKQDIYLALADQAVVANEHIIDEAVRRCTPEDRAGEVFDAYVRFHRDDDQLAFRLIALADALSPSARFDDIRRDFGERIAAVLVRAVGEHGDLARTAATWAAVNGLFSARTQGFIDDDLLDQALASTRSWATGT